MTEPSSTTKGAYVCRMVDLVRVTAHPDLGGTVERCPDVTEGGGVSRSIERRKAELLQDPEVKLSVESRNFTHHRVLPFQRERSPCSDA